MCIRDSGSDVVFNANAIVSQYCAYKDTDATSISKDDMESLLAANKDKLYSFTYTDEVREVDVYKRQVDHLRLTI